MIVVLTFAASLLVGIPIAFAIGLTGMAHIAVLGNQFFDVYIQRMVSGVNNSSLLCIPFFVLAGELMNRGGITERILNFIRECIGFVRGGLAYATVIVGALLSAILGSSNAVASILCTSIVPELKKDGYDGDFAVCVSASSGILGPIIPPGVSMVIMGVLTGASIKSLFFSGIFPGILLALGFMAVVRIYTVKRHYPKLRESFDAKAACKALWRAGPSLLVPFVILVGVTFGVFTPAEAGCVAVAIAMISGFAYKTLKIEDLFKIFMKSIYTSSSILLIVAFGNVLGWTLAIDQIPATLSKLVLSVTDNGFLVLCLLMLIMLIVGFFIEGYSAMLIFGPVFATVATSVGIDLVHFCMLFIIIVNIGLLTPPVGMILFVSSNITGEPLTSISKAIWPFVLVACIALLIMMCFPQIMLYIPSLLV